MITQIMIIQKQNIDGLNNMNSKKTQRLLNKVQKDPGVARRIRQLEELEKVENSLPFTTTSKSLKREFKPLVNEIENVEDDLIKKRKLNEDFHGKEESTSASKSENSIGSDFDDTPKSSKHYFVGENSENQGQKGLFSNSFSHSSAFSAFGVTKQAN